MEEMLVLTYNSVFDDYEDSLTPESFLEDIPSINVLEIISWMTAQIHRKECDTSSIQHSLLTSCEGYFPEETKRALSAFVENNQKFIFINNQSSLMMDEVVLSNYNNLLRKPILNLTNDELLNIFKAYLICSQRWTDKQSQCEAVTIQHTKSPLWGLKWRGLCATNCVKLRCRASSQIEHPNEYPTGMIRGAESSNVKSEASNNEDPIEKVMLKQDMPIVEFKRYKNFVTQLYKAGLFFKFCEQNSCFSIYLGLFLKEKNVSDWHEYLCSVLSFYVEPIRQNTRNSIIKFRETDIKPQEFLEQFILDVDSFEIESDFGALRNNFVLKITNDEYMILNYNLLVDKIYQGLQFDFYNTLIKNGALNKKGKKIKDFGEYKSMLGDEFSETDMFYKIIERVVENKNYIKLSGEEIKGKTGNGEPDYYIRDNNNLFLFEMKDVIINKDIKLSDEIKVIHDGICSKICKDNGKERKGGGQLLYNIDRFYKNVFISLDECNTENISAYPIIVVNDSAFDANGVSNLFFREFDKILDSKYPHLREKVNKPILINLDALIYLLPHFKDNSITLSRIIKRYISEFENNPLLKYRSFTDFVLETYSDKTYDMKDLLKSLLFPDIKLEEEKNIKMRKEKHKHKSSKKRKSAIKRRRERKRNRKRRKHVR